MIFFKLGVAALTCHLVSVYSVSIPSNQQIAGSDVSPSRLLPTGPSNLTIPPSIPGFGVQTLFASKPTLILWQVFANAIGLMYLLAVKPADNILTSYVQVDEDIYIERVVISPWPDQTPSRLRIKHGIVALYEAGTALAKIPIRQPGLVPTVYAIISLEGQQIGVLKWLHKSSSQNSEANSTVSLVSAQNSTGALQLSRRNPRNNVRTFPKTIVDPEDRKFKVAYEVGDKKTDLPEAFSAFLEAMAIAGLNDASAAGAHVQAVSVSGDVVVNVNGFGMPSRLSWGQLLKSLLLIWLFVIGEENLVEVDFELSYDGVVTGHGFIWSLNPPRAGLLSS